MTAERTEAERLADLHARRADVYSEKRERNPYYGDADIDLLLGEIARLRELKRRQPYSIGSGERSP